MNGYSYADSEYYAVSGVSIEKLLDNGDGMLALAYLFLLKNKGAVSADTLSCALKISVESARELLTKLVRLGLIASIGETPAVTAQSYTARDLENAMRNTEFAALYHEAENVFASPVTADEARRLFYIFDHIGLSAGVIMLLLQFCKSEHRRTFGPSRRLSMARVEKTAQKWKDNGITTEADAETYITAQEKYHSLEGSVRRILGISNRKPTQSEANYIESWIGMGFPPESVQIAYERTVNRTHAVNFKYMDKIFLSWHANNLHTPEEIAQHDPETKLQKASAEQSPASAGSGTQEELDRMNALIEELKKK